MADATLSLWSYVLRPDSLDELFQRHRGRRFEQALSFPTFVGLIADALLRCEGSGRRAFRCADEQGRMPTSAQAAYGKLRRIPIGLSPGLLEDVTARLLPLRPPRRAEEWPAGLAGLTVVLGDGKTIRRVAKRLLPARGAAGKLYGGKLLAAFLPAWGLVTALAADPDGAVNEAKLVPAWLPRARARIPGPRLWVLDRQSCDPVQAERLTRDGDHFPVRYHRQRHSVPDPQRPAAQGQDRRGREYVQGWGWLGAEGNQKRRYVRRITLHRPGEEDVVLVTDLLDGAAQPAADLLEVYRQRWRIEQVFQQITEVFALERLIGSTPEATVFQASLCLVLSNLAQVMRRSVAQSRPQPCPVASLSAEQLFADVRQELTALARVVPAAEVAALFPAARALAELRRRLVARLRQGSRRPGRWRSCAGAWWPGCGRAPRRAGTRRSTASPGRGYRRRRGVASIPRSTASAKRTAKKE